MRLLLLISSLVAVALCVHLVVLRPARAAHVGQQPIFLRAGDVVQVSGAPLGCRVVVLGGLKTLDCRIVGSLAGSYGTLMSARRVQVVRFRSARLAKIIFVATQQGSFRTCR
jgi:hypothetical protein